MRQNDNTSILDELRSTRNVRDDLQNRCGEQQILISKLEDDLSNVNNMRETGKENVIQRPGLVCCIWCTERLRSLMQFVFLRTHCPLWLLMQSFLHCLTRLLRYGEHLLLPIRSAVQKPEKEKVARRLSQFSLARGIVIGRRTWNWNKLV